ncbi:MAG: hypothetical protein ACLFM8_07905 [Halobacteriales archaeon]
MTADLDDPRVYVPLMVVLWTLVAVGLDVFVLDGNGVAGATFGLAGGIAFGLSFWFVRRRSV